MNKNHSIVILWCLSVILLLPSVSGIICSEGSFISMIKYFFPLLSQNAYLYVNIVTILGYLSLASLIVLVFSKRKAFNHSCSLGIKVVYLLMIFISLTLIALSVIALIFINIDVTNIPL